MKIFFLTLLLLPFAANAQETNRFWENPESSSTIINRAWVETQGTCSANVSAPVKIVKSSSTTLSLKERGLGMSEMLDLIMTTSNFPKVNSLDLRGATLTKKDLRQLNSLTPRMTGVTDLYLGDTKVEDKGTLINFILLNLAPKLEILDLSGISLSPDDAGKLAGIIGRMSNLRVLYLGDNAIGDAGFNRLMNASFYRLSKLQILSLKYNNLTDKSLKRFAREVFPLMKNLQILDLKNNEFSKETAEFLLRYSLNLTQLAVLDLGDGYEGVKGDQSSALMRCQSYSSQSFVDSQ